jgi:2'-5' RNA ligase
VEPAAAISEARAILSSFDAFDIELGGIEKFSATDVIYISVERGQDHLRQMHRLLNRGALAFDEPFTYHPHVTLAQEIPPDKLDALFASASEMWQAYSGPRSFRAEHAVFVRNIRGHFWMDLATGTLRGALERHEA